jgi:hypothetical protein
MALTGSAWVSLLRVPSCKRGLRWARTRRPASPHHHAVHTPLLTHSSIEASAGAMPECGRG